MSALGRISNNIGSIGVNLDVDLNQASMSAIQAQNEQINNIPQEVDYLDNIVIGDQGKTIIENADGTTTENKTSVRDNLSTLYEMITGVATVLEPELAVPLIEGKALYDEANHLYNESHSIYESINIFKNLVGHPHSENEVQDTDEDGNLKWYDPETQTLPIYKTIEPSGLHARAYNLEQLLKIINTVEEASTIFELVNVVPKEYNYRDHLCINNDNEDGEIRFITKEAYKFNDHNYNWNGYNYFDPVELFVGSDNYFYKDPRKPNPDDPEGPQLSNRLNYNVKIGKDGRLYFWHNEYILTLPQWTAIIGPGSGWYELDTAFNSVAFNVFLNQIQIAYLSTKITSKAVSEGAVAAVKGATTTVKEALLLFLDQFRQAALTSIVVVSGLVAGQLLIDNANTKALQDSILDLDKDLNSLLLEIEKIEKEIQNIDDGKARDPDNKPFDDPTLSKTDLEELKTKYLEIVDAIKQERLRQQKILLKRIGFIHIDYLEDSKFNLDEVLDEDGNFTNYKLKSAELDQVIANVGVQRSSEIEPTGIFLKIDNLYNLIGNKTLTTPPKEPSGILGNIEALQNDTSDNSNNIVDLSSNIDYHIDRIDQEILGIDINSNSIIYLSNLIGNDDNGLSLIGRIDLNSNNIVNLSNIIGIGSTDGSSITSQIEDLQLGCNILKQQIDSIRDITGYDDSSLLYLLLPPNSDGTIPSIQENTINNDSLIHLGYKGSALKENFSDYFILYVMPHYSISTAINSANIYLVRDLISNKEPYQSGLQIQNDNDGYLSALTGYFIYDQIYLNNDWYFSIYLKNLQSYNNILYRYNNIEVLINTTQLVVSYKKYITSEIHYLDNVWTDGLQINIVNYFGRNNVVRMTNTYSYYQNHSITFLSANPNRQLSDYYNMFLDNGEYQKGFNMYPFKNSSGDYIVYHTGANFAPLSQWKISVARNWTKPAIIGGETIYIRIFIMATNTLPSSYANFTMIYESDVKSLSQAQYTSLSTFTLNTGNTTAYNYWLIGYIYTNSSGNVITDHDTQPLMIGKLRQLYVLEQQEYQNNEITHNHNITFGNDFKHLAFNDRVATENKIVYYADGIEKGTINIPSDRVLANDNTFLLGGTHTYRAFGIGNGILTTENLNEISQLSKTNYRVRIPELTVMDEVYITETLILENDIQFRNRADGSTFNYYTETDSSGLRRRQGIQEDGEVVDTFTYTDELIFRTTPTQNQFLFYNIATGQFEGVNTTDFYTKVDIDSKGYLTNDNILDVVRTADISDVVRTADISDVLRTADITDVVRTTDISDVVRNNQITDVVRTVDISDVVRTADISDVVRNNQITDVVRTADITDVVRNNQITDVVRTEDISDVVRNDDITDVVRNNQITDVVRTADITDVVRTSDISDVVDTTQLNGLNYVSYDDFAKNQASEINPGIVKYNDQTEKFYTVNKIQKEDVDGLIDTIQNIPNVYTIAETFPVLNHLILDDYFQVSPVEYLELYVKYDDFTYTLAPHLYIQYTYLGNTYYKSTYDTTAINIHKHDIIRFVAEQISSDNEALYTHQYYYKNELGNIISDINLDSATNWEQQTTIFSLNYQIQLYRSNRDGTNEILLTTFKIIEQSYNKQFKPDVIPKVVQDITKINNNLQIDYSDTTNATISIFDNSLVKDIQVSGGFLNYTQLDDTVISRTLPFVENDVDAVLTFFEGTTFTRNSANKIDLLEIDTFNENIIINGSASYGSGSIQLNCENNTHNIKIIAPAHSTFSGGNYSLTLPTNLGTTGQVLSITPNSLTRDGRLFWTDRINILDFNESQFETVSGKISIIPSVLGSGGGGGVSISDFNPTQFETNPAGEITIKEDVLGSGGGGGVVDYDAINVPYESQQTTTTETVNVVASVSPEYISQSTITEYTVLDADATNLKAWYKFDGDFTDSSGNGNDGTLISGTVNYINGVINQAISLSNNTRLEINNPENVFTSGQTEMSFSFWINNLLSSKTSQTILRYRNNNVIIRYNYSNNKKLEFYLEGGLMLLSLPNGITSWTNIVLVAYNDIRKVYVNGIEDTENIEIDESGTLDDGFTHDDPINKLQFFNNSGYGEYVYCDLDDFRIYDKALTPTEIGYLANNMVKLEPQPVYETQTTITEYTVLDADADHLVAHYKFDTGEELTDSVGNYPLTNDGSVSFSTDTKIVGKSSYFPNNDTDGFLNITGGINPYNIWYGKGISFSIWYKVNINDSDLAGRIFEFGNTNAHLIWMAVQLSGTGDNNLNLYAKGGHTGGNGPTISVGNGTLDGNWHHIVWIVDTNSDWHCYIDGINQNITANWDIPNITGGYTTNRLGKSIYKNDTTQDLKGYLDDFRIYDKALTPTEIGYLANKMIVNPEYKTLTFTYDSGNDVSGQTPYTLTFDNPTECDILIVGGGGAGGGNGQGGGGGAGTVIYFEDLHLTSGQYTIKVGKGGQGVFTANAGSNGNDTEFQKNNGTKKFLAKGGGGGGTWNANGYLPKVGGSGGGGAGDSNGGGITTGNIVNDVNVNIISNTYNNTGYTGDRGINSLNDTGCFGNIGGNEPAGGDNDWGAGGGGAGSSGAPTIQGSNDIAGDGGSGKKYDISGIEQFYGGGGGGGMRPTIDFSNGRPGNGGNGGGGNGGGGPSGTGGSGSDAVNGTGGGGGGVGAIDTSNTKGGNGGSGIVIIRYKTTYNQTITVGADIKPKGIMTHTDAGWQLIDMTDFSIIQALVSEITLLKQRLNTLETTPTPTNTIVWSYRYFDTTRDITINDGTIIQLDNTRVKHKVSIKITYISDFVDIKTYQATLEISGAQYGGFDILSVPQIINEVNESDLPTGSPINYIYQVVEDSIVIGSKTIELYRPPGDVELNLTYRITTSSSSQVFSTDSDPVVNIPTGTWYELFIDDINLYIVGVNEYDIYVEIEESDGSTYGDTLWTQEITSFPVAQYLLSGVWSSDRIYRIKIRPSGAGAYTTPLLTATIYGSDRFSGGVGGGTI